MTNIVVQPEVIQALAECIIDVIQNKVDWGSIDWQAVAEKAVERPKGEWIELHEGLSLYYHICSNCKKQPLELQEYEVLSDFCPHCGADMRKEKIQ